MTSIDDILGTANEPAAEIKESAVTMTDAIAMAGVHEAIKESPTAEVDSIMEALMARISPVGEAVKYHKLMLFGEFGTGKTVFSATAPRPLIVAVEPTGPLSLKNHPELEAKTRIFEFKSVFQVETLLNKILELPEAKVHEVFGETLVIDSFSEFQNSDLDDTLIKAARADSGRDRYLPTGPDYNINTEHMRQIGSLLERIPMHVILTCHVKEEKDDSTGRILKRPNLTPKLARTMSGKFDIVGYLSMDTDSQGNAVRKLQCHPTTSIAAKTRVGGIAPVVENPTWDSLFDKE